MSKRNLKQKIELPHLSQGMYGEEEGELVFLHYGQVYPISLLKEALQKLPDLLSSYAKILQEGTLESKKIKYKYFTEKELEEIEKTYSDGLTADEIVKLCRDKGMRFSKPTLRLYVSKGILQPSERRKRKTSGKRYSSIGVYQTSSVRRITHTKYLLEEEDLLEELFQ